MSLIKRFSAELLRFAVVALCCAIFGVGIGFIQGEIAARGDDKIYQVTFAGGAAMIGGVVAFFLGPILYYALKRQIPFEYFCSLCVLSSGAGCAAAWFLSGRPGDRGWESIFVTPIAAIFFAFLLVGRWKSNETALSG